MLIQFQPPCYVQGRQPPDQLVRATSSLALNASRDGASTAFLGNLFQCVTSSCVENLLLISNLNLPCLCLKPFPLVLSLSTLVNSRLLSLLGVHYRECPMYLSSATSTVYHPKARNVCYNLFYSFFFNNFKLYVLSLVL